MDRLIISNLSKTYANGVQALQDISLEVSTGMFGLLGPNGAGKSTLMRTIATLQEADEGKIRFGGIDVFRQARELRNILGYLPQEFGLYPRISAMTLLDHFAVLKGVTDAKERKALVERLLHKVNLYHVRKQKLGSFSGGMKQRFGIAQALLNQPKLLIVDEPTAGLDPVERNRFYNLLSQIAENTVVILSTHIIEDVKSLCKKIAIIHQGKVVRQGSPLEILDSMQGVLYRKRIDKQELPDYQKAYHVISEQYHFGEITIHIVHETQPGDGFEAIGASLEDAYLSAILQA